MTKLPSKHVEIDLDEDATGPAAIVDEDRPIQAGNTVDADIVDEDMNPLDKLPEDAIKNTDGSVTLPLLFPVTIRSKKDGKIREKTYADLTFHRLVGADQRAIASAKDEDMAVVSFARSTRINQAVMNALFDRMDAADITRAGRVINHFLSNGPKTGR